MDGVLAATRRGQKRVRRLPSRVVVYFVLTMTLFPACGYAGVWASMTAGLRSRAVEPSAAALRAARRRVGVEPFALLFARLRGPVATKATAGAFWQGLRLVAWDATTVEAADTADNVALFKRHRSGHGPAGCPQVHLSALVECGTRALIDAVFGPRTGGEAGQVRGLLRSLTPGVLLLADRPFLEARLRDRVLALPNVSLLPARATGLLYDDGAASAVRYADAGEAEGILAADFFVDATGRSSRLPEWVSEAGYDRPELERLKSPINYATALFTRETADADLVTAAQLSIHTAEFATGGVSVAAADAVEGKQWLVMLMGYGDDRPGRTLGELRDLCAELPGVFAEATSGTVTRDVVTYHQEESRRRDFTGLNRFPARLVGVGDAVASFNPVYGQGMSSAVLHASCLSTYLTDDPDLTGAATAFFHLQQIVVDAAWMVSAGGDSARLDALNGVEVPEEVRPRRAALQQVIGASTADATVAGAFKDVSYMLRHPATLADPALLERVAAVHGNG